MFGSYMFSQTLLAYYSYLAYYLFKILKNLFFPLFSQSELEHVLFQPAFNSLRISGEKQTNKQTNSVY